MEITQTTDILVSSNTEKGLKKALLFTVICLFGVIFFLDFESPNISQLRRSYGQSLMPIMGLIALYFWFQYFKDKRNYMRITKEYIYWGRENKEQRIEWSKVKSVEVVNLASISSQTGIIYEFNISGSVSTLSAKPTLNLSEYNIEAIQLQSIVEQLAEKIGFSVYSGDKQER